MGDIAARINVQRNALAVEGQHIACLNSQVRDTKRGDLTYSRVGQRWHGEEPAVEYNREFIGNSGRAQDVSVETQSRGCLKASPRQRLIQGLDALHQSVRQWCGGKGYE